MRKKTNIQSWLQSLTIAATLAGTAGFCQAQTSITLSNDSSESPAFYDGGPTGATYTWQSTGGPNGGGCIQGVIDGVTTTEFDPSFNVSFNGAQYLQVTIQLMVDPSSGTTGTLGSGGYGNLQLALRDANYSWNSIWHGTIYPPAANGWVTYTFTLPNPYITAAHLQFQLQGGTYSGPVTIYIGNVVVSPIPNPWLATAFTDSSWGPTPDTTEDAPYYNPVTGAGPTSITPAGSWELQISDPGSYSWNQFGNGTIDTTRYQWVGFDVFLDGSSGSTYGGVQLLFFNNGWSGQTWVGSITFNASMVGKWTHFNFPSSASGVTACPQLVLQTTPGSDGGTDTTTFHIDNLVFWNNETKPKILSMKANNQAGGVRMAADGAGDQYNRNQLVIPSGSNVLNHFWINQTPATYSMTITNFPAPAAAPGFEGHFYIANESSVPGFYETSGSPDWNAADLVVFRVQNGTNGGIVSTFEWKTNSPNSNPTNVIYCALPNVTSANGTWTVNFSDNIHGSIIGPMGVVTNFTLPNISNDPNYTGNFTPAESLMYWGVFKNDVLNNGDNNGASFVLSSLLVTNAINGVLYNDNFPGIGLTANYPWRTSSNIYIQWQPYGIAYWLMWNTTQSGWSVLSTGNLKGSWSSAGVSYSYADATGTNTLGAIPAASLPAGNAGFFELMK
jgi:hypothetical protein